MSHLPLPRNTNSPITSAPSDSRGSPSQVPTRVCEVSIPPSQFVHSLHWLEYYSGREALHTFTQPAYSYTPTYLAHHTLLNSPLITICYPPAEAPVHASVLSLRRAVVNNCKQRIKTSLILCNIRSHTTVNTLKRIKFQNFMIKMIVVIKDSM